VPPQAGALHCTALHCWRTFSQKYGRAGNVPSAFNVAADNVSDDMESFPYAARFPLPEPVHGFTPHGRCHGSFSSDIMCSLLKHGDPITHPVGMTAVDEYARPFDHRYV
jgi:hypothetical protein